MEKTSEQIDELENEDYKIELLKVEHKQLRVLLKKLSGGLNQILDKKFKYHP